MDAKCTANQLILVKVQPGNLPIRIQETGTVNTNSLNILHIKN